MLVYLVIDYLANTNIRGYGFPRPILDTLLSLCLVSTASVHDAQSALYSSVEMKSESGLVLFLRTLEENPTLATRVKALFLLDVSHTRFDYDRGWVYVDNPHFVTIGILLAVSQSLRRLVIDRAFESLFEMHIPLHQRLRPKYRKALESCTGLEELVSVQDSLCVEQCPIGIVVWPQMAHLKRLSLHGPLIGRKFLHALHAAQANYGQALEWFVGFNSDFERGMEKAELDEGLRKLKALKGFTLCDRGPDRSRHILRLEGGLVKGVVMGAFDSDGKGKVIEEPRGYVREGGMPWFDHSASDK